MVSFDICEGNPGALQFLMKAYDIDPLLAEVCSRRMEDSNIKGSKLYMLWNDCCGRDTNKAMTVMISRNIDEILEHINEGGGRGIPFEDETDDTDKTGGYFCKILFDLIAKHRISVHIENGCFQDRQDEFHITIERGGMHLRFCMSYDDLSSDPDAKLVYAIKDNLRALQRKERELTNVAEKFLRIRKER